MAGTVSLASIPLFAGLQGEHVAELERRTRRLTLQRGETLFLEGDQPQGFYLVRSGRLKVYKSSPAGREQILHMVGPGEPVGEVAMFGGGRLPASAEALETSEVLVVPREAFVDLIRREPEVAMRFLSALSERLRLLTTLVESLSLREVTERLAGYILHLSNSQRDAAQGAATHIGAAPASGGLQAAGAERAAAPGGGDTHIGAAPAGGVDQVELPLSRTELASLLGTVPETLSRAFLKLAQQGLIEADRRTVTIKDRTGLEEAAWAGRRLT